MDGNEERCDPNERHYDVAIQCCAEQIISSQQIKIAQVKQTAGCKNGDCVIKNAETVGQNASSRNLGKRKRRIASLSPVCPVCGLTLRPGEIKEHYEKEVKMLNDFDDPTSKSSLKWQKRLNSSHSKKGKNSGSAEKCDEYDLDEQERVKKSKERQEKFLRIKKERRLRHAKLLLFNVPHQPQLNEGPSEYHIVKCPVCNVQIEGSEEDLSWHVQRCLMKQEGDVDSENSDAESAEEYTWAGQTRIRATTLLEGGLSACSGDPIKLQMTNEDEELDIDGDFQTEFGVPQYTEKDIIPCSADIPADNEAQDRIRAALSIDQEPSISRESSRNRWTSNDNGSCSGDGTNLHSDLNGCNESSDETVESLKERIVNLTDELHKEKLKCLICMEGFDTPLVSVICWHVYCDECWLRTLGAKKLCPQCNTITSPADLRRIFI